MKTKERITHNYIILKIYINMLYTFHRSEHFLENSEKLTDVSGCFFLCSSLQVWTKYA